MAPESKIRRRARCVIMPGSAGRSAELVRGVEGRAFIMWTRGLASIICVAGLGIGTGCDRESPVRFGPEGRGEHRDGPPVQREPPLKDADAYAARASEWLREGDFDRALKDYDQAIRLRQDQAPFWNNRGFTWHMKGYQKEDRPAFEDRAWPITPRPFVSIRVPPPPSITAPGCLRPPRLIGAEMDRWPSKEPRGPAS